ncbi:5-methylcytosine restriction system component-like protein [Cellulophaga lytica DSM 7489]|uniref:5-methylcytosine restriction system component-like protein n=1 Tax=Cellulophaga lytica (strain ATCC 23178 / DSM 7489 / JCM 8516 / NBRC 14961 / NCIMB 1423 / VKM B-1433 / Cy l20) TaxID=867900 RepID=F0RDC6_CELLC|nr:restriction endonuclease [Cellulophaga lytica]ADY30868.1 5-methylcytosine restriction system component-like protein [Cellulophaga lytica DSM 7489]WQG78213.1 restriction endonuclease [Cellulophaga lytica]
MKTLKAISVFEHQRLTIGEQGFKQAHLDALLRLNEYHNGTYFQPIAKGIKFNQYVGVIQVDGLTIEINPKADRDDDDAKWKGVLLKMLQSCGKLKAKSTGAANVKRKHLNLLEVYFELYLLEVESLMRKGLIKQYRKETKNTKALKGKLEFAGHLRRNIIHKERFYTKHQVYDADHLLHQVLQKALGIVSLFTNGSRLQDLANRIQLNFPEVANKTITAKELNTIQLNRKSNGYSYALELARLIILNYSPDIASGKEKMLSLLFDMNELWETYILKQLQEISEASGIDISGQETKSFWGANYLKPDIVLRTGDKAFIIDTKWKRPQKSSASVGDLRQMYAYCRFWDAQKALLLYPGNFRNNSFKTYKTDDYSLYNTNEASEIDHQCKLGYVSVLNENGELSTTVGESILKLLELRK